MALAIEVVFPRSGFAQYASEAASVAPGARLETADPAAAGRFIWTADRTDRTLTGGGIDRGSVAYSVLFAAKDSANAHRIVVALLDLIDTAIPA
jgi:hypothetical protein